MRHDNLIYLSLMFFVFITICAAKIALAEDSETKSPSWSLSAELGSVWQSNNDVRIPGVGGTRFDLSDFSSGPFFAYRFYLNYFFNDHHAVRLLYAPFKITVDGSSNQNIIFDGSTFAANIPLEAEYKFNSYRLTYIYSFERRGPWQFKIGFSGKIRDAKVSLQNGITSESYKNVGFVPLAYGNIAYYFSPKIRLDLDVEALAAPQGRAEDVALKVFYKPVSDFELGFGYRMVEGGADNDKVYTFAWLHYMVLSFTLLM